MLGLIQNSRKKLFPRFISNQFEPIYCLKVSGADRKFPPTRILDLKLTVSSSAREVVSIWSEAMAETLQGNGLTEVSEKRFDWKPW